MNASRQRQLVRLRVRIEFGQRRFEKREPARVADLAIRAADPGLECGASAGALTRASACSNLFDRGLRGPARIVDVADLLVDRVPTSSSRCSASADSRAWSRNLSASSSANTRVGIARRSCAIGERSRQVPGLHEMVREILRMPVGARPRRFAVAHGRIVGLFQRLADALVQAASANRIQFLVEHFADLVVREREVVVAASGGRRRRRRCSRGSVARRSPRRAHRGARPRLPPKRQPAPGTGRPCPARRPCAARPPSTR